MIMKPWLFIKVFLTAFSHRFHINSRLKKSMVRSPSLFSRNMIPYIIWIMIQKRIFSKIIFILRRTKTILYRASSYKGHQKLTKKQIRNWNSSSLGKCILLVNLGSENIQKRLLNKSSSNEKHNFFRIFIWQKL